MQIFARDRTRDTQRSARVVARRKDEVCCGNGCQTCLFGKVLDYFSSNLSEKVSSIFIFCII